MEVSYTKAKLLELLRKKPLNFWEILAKNRFLLKDVIATLNELYKEGAIKIEEGKISLKDFESPKAEEIKLCSKCNGKLVEIPKEMESIFQKFSEICRKRGKPNPEYFQGYIIPDDVLARVAFMEYHGDVANKNILLIGDDDLLSVCLCLTNLPKKVVVVDIDKNLGKFIESVSKEHGLNIEFIEYDVAQPLPEELIGKFDMFSTEPLETTSGFLAFLARGMASLKQYGSGYIGLTVQEVRFERWREFERMVLESNFVITDILREFSRYSEEEYYEEFAKELAFNPGRNPGIYWYKSALFRIEALGNPKPPKKPEEKIEIEVVGEEDYTHPTLRKL